MGLFEVTVEIGDPISPVFQEVKPVVDTGAVYSILPASLLEHIGLSPSEEQPFKLADGSRQTFGLGEVRFRIDGRERTTPVVFGPDGVYLLGAVSLESLGLIADTTHRRLIPAPELHLVGIQRPRN
jgi:clan AA aspartic protease